MRLEATDAFHAVGFLGMSIGMLLISASVVAGTVLACAAKPFPALKSRLEWSSGALLMSFCLLGSSLPHLGYL